jgi:hypothetical protein
LKNSERAASASICGIHGRNGLDQWVIPTLAKLSFGGHGL